MAKLTDQQIQDAQLDDWRKRDDALHARFRTGDFIEGLKFVTAIAVVAEQANHHPDVTLTYPSVELELTSHDVGHLTKRDLDLAGRISEIARERGLDSEQDG